MNKLRPMMLFMHIVQQGSITQAAERLGLSKSVLSQHLKQLESNLGTSLLKRTTRQQTLTSAGADFYQHCVSINNQVEIAWAQAINQQAQPSGTLTVTAPFALMDSIVIPALSHTFANNNQLKLNVIASDKKRDLITENIDLAIRVGESKSSSLKQKRLGEFRDVLCGTRHSSTPIASNPYIANHWQAKKIQHTFSDPQAKQHTVEFDATHRTTTMMQTIALIESGFGVGVVPALLLSAHPKLVPLLPNYQLPSINVYALHPYQQHTPHAVTMAIQAIEKYLQTS